MTFHVAIIGAGLGGITLALHLQSVPEITLTVYELRSEDYEQGQHISLAPNALRVMRNMGVLDKLEAIGNTYEELHLRNASGSRIATFHNGHSHDYGFGAMRIHRRHVQRVLTEEAKKRGIKICNGMKVMSISEIHNQQKVEIAFQSGDATQADFVIGTDGLHSVVRSYVVPDSASIFAGMVGVTGFLNRKKLHPSGDWIDLPSHFIGQNAFIAIMPSDVSGDEIGFFSTMDFKQEQSREEWNNLFQDKQRIRAILKERFTTDHGWCMLIHAMCDTVEGNTLCSWPFYISPPLPNWTSESSRVVILGDAAHAMIPTGGLGASLAFEDAECLLHALNHVATSNFDQNCFRKSIIAWEAHRRDRLAIIQNFTDLNRRMRQPGGSWIMQYLKEWYIWLRLKLPGSSLMAREIYGYNTNVFKELLEIA